MAIQMQTVMAVADNSGAKRVRVIKVLGETRRMISKGYGGLPLVVSVIEALPSGKIREGEIHYAIPIRLKVRTERIDGSNVKFDDNAVVLVDKKNHEPLGSRVFGPVAREVGYKNKRILSLASEVV